MEVLIVILILLAVLVSVLGIIGAIAPAIPGPPLNFGALVIAYLTMPGYVSGTVVLVMLAVTIAVSVLDYVAPIWLTKLGGGSKMAMWGSTLGMFLGLFSVPWGLVLGPLIGAFIGEMLHNSQDIGKACKVALMSFIAFLLTTGLKLAASLVMTYFTLAAFAHKFFNFASNVILPFS